MVDPSRIRRLLQVLSGYRDELRRLDALAADEYEEHVYSARYLVQAAAQSCIDIANHVIASERWRTPKDFRDAFSVLEENEVLPGPVAGRLRDLSGLRNRLVHLYDDVDDTIVHEALAEAIVDVEAFAQAIARLAE